MPEPIDLQPEIEHVADLLSKDRPEVRDLFRYALMLAASNGGIEISTVNALSLPTHSLVLTKRSGFVSFQQIDMYALSLTI